MIRAPLNLKFLAALAAGAAALSLPLQADAHHSATMYDTAKVVTVTGSVKEFHWMNPHVIVEVVSKDASGVDRSWNFECSSPGILVRNGWSAHALTAGSKVQVQMRPLKDGGNAGLMLMVTTPAGVVLKDHGGVSAPALREG
jgi:hypothetical protein